MTAPLPERLGAATVASMRPGQEAPDDYRCHQGRGSNPRASMRPGQEAPDDPVFAGGGRLPLLASMRPGQEAPDDAPPSRHGLAQSASFNEAGARSPG